MDNQDRCRCCFENWVTQEHQDLDELLHGLAVNPTDADYLRNITQKVIKHFQDYYESRAELAQLDAPSFLCPSWLSSFEKSYFWIGGCRASLNIRLVYSHCRSELEEILGGDGERNLGNITANQHELINILHCLTLREEGTLSNRMATLQEDIADYQLLKIANESDQVGESSQEVDRAMEAHSLALAQILVEADKLRLNTLKELIDVLSPLQAADLLVASKKLHLSMHEWGKCRDLSMGNIQVILV